MKKITHVSLTSAFAVTALLASITANVYAYAPITSQLDLGETNADVSNLQTFFKDNASIYPEGMVTGYFGGLTRSAVLRFQATHGLAQAGRVGPLTRDTINSLITSGGWSTSSSDASGPSIYNVNKQITGNSATFSWNTDEMASAKVFYSTSPVTMNEGDINSVGFGATSGWTSTNDMLTRQSQQVIVSGLLSNTTYYYVIVSTDLKGNVSVWNPNTTFRTN